MHYNQDHSEDQDRLVEAAEKSQWRRKPAPTRPVANTSINVMYFADGKWQCSDIGGVIPKRAFRPP